MNTQHNTHLRSALDAHKDVNAIKDKIRQAYAEVSTKAEHHTAGAITADALIRSCVHADAQLHLLFKQL